MQSMQAESREWSDFRKRLEGGDAPPGIVLVEGASEVVARQVQSFLQHASFEGVPFQYFLCSGSDAFRVPCYTLFGQGEAEAEPVRHFHILQEQPTIHAQPTIAVSKLERGVMEASSSPHFLVLEYLVPPGRHDLLFTSQLCFSPLACLIPVVIFVHGLPRSNRRPPQGSPAEKMLVQLYLCGGRIRIEEWIQLQGNSPTRDTEPLLLARRCTASETWICYAHRGIAEQAKELYRTMKKNKRDTLVCHVLHSLPYNTLIHCWR